MLPDVFIHPSSVIDAGAQVGAGTRIWHFCHLMPRCRVGTDCVIGQNVFIDNDVVIGNGVKIQNNVSVYTGVVLEDGVFIGPSVVFTNVHNPRAFKERKNEFRPTVVRQGASIGANATLVCGAEVGAYAFVGAGSVVTKTVASFALCYGNPAQRRGWRSRDGYPLDFNALGEAFCAPEGISYRLQHGTVQRCR